MTKNQIIIATRKSPLAMWQAEWVKSRLERSHPVLTVSILGLSTTADNIATPLYEMGGKGLFVKELEEALLEKRADIAVHSMKDVPMVLPEGLSLPVICQREDPRDVFISLECDSLEQMRDRAVVGTSSLRRQSQICALRPDLQVRPLRGNVNSRLQKLDDHEFDAIILASAGLFRLDLQNRINSYLSIDQSLPAAGQGAMGIECRTGDVEIEKWIAPLQHDESFVCVTAERALCRRLDAGCRAPVAAYADWHDNEIVLRGLVASPDGKTVIRAQKTGSVYDAEALGLAVAEELLRQGADGIIKACLK